MATTSAITCVNPNISLDEMANSILVEHVTTKVTGLLTTIIEADSGDLVKVASCGNVPLSGMQILRMAFGIDDDGDTTLVLYVKV